MVVIRAVLFTYLYLHVRVYVCMPIADTACRNGYFEWSMFPTVRSLNLSFPGGSRRFVAMVQGSAVALHELLTGAVSFCFPFA